MFPELASVRREDDGLWSPVPGAEVLLREGDRPLLSRIARPGGSDIYYLHRNPRELEGDVRDATASLLIKRLGLPRNVQKSSRPVLAHRFEGPGFEVLNIWTGLNLPGFKGGYGPHLMPARGADQFDRSKRPYPFLMPESDTTLEVPVPEEGAYRVFAFLAGNDVTAQTSPQRTITLQIHGASAEQFFFAKDSPEFRKTIENLRARRKRLLPFGPDLPNP
jgi:hypothetical protein